MERSTMDEMKKTYVDLCWDKCYIWSNKQWENSAKFSWEVAWADMGGGMGGG
jgi:hypothetical protein